MFRAYQQLPTRFKAVGFIGLVFIALVLSLTSVTTFALPIVTIICLILLHVFLSHPKNLVLITTILLYLGLNYVLLTAIPKYGQDVANITGLDLNIAMMMFATTQTVALISYIFIAYSYSRGTIALNLIIAILLQNAVGFSVLLLNVTFYVFALIAGVIAGISYLLLRIPRQKKKPVVRKASLTQKTHDKIERLLQSNSLTFSAVDTIPGIDYFAYNDKAAYAITVIPVNKMIITLSTGLYIDGESQSALLELSQSELNQKLKLSNSNAINHILLYFVKEKTMASQMSDIVQLKVHKWKQPDHLLGITTVCSRKGFSTFVKASTGENKTLSAKTQAKIEHFVTN